MRYQVIRGGLLLDRGQASPADVLIEDSRIVACGTDVIVPPDTIVIEAADRLVVPGLVNAHTHGHGALGRGAVEDRVNLEMFLAAIGAINGGRTAEDKYLSAALSAVELIRKGCTAAFDMFAEWPLPTLDGVQAVVNAYMDCGFRAVVAPMMADLTLFHAVDGLAEALPADLGRPAPPATAAAIIAACRHILLNWPGPGDLVRPGVAPAIPLHCTDDFLRACNTLAREFGLPLQTHLAETRTQAMNGLRRHGHSLTCHLDRLGLLGPHFSAAHGIWLEADDLATLARHGAAIAHNPASNLRLGSGIAKLRNMLDHGVTVGIGTDASNTSDGQNMFEVTRLASFLSRIGDSDPARWVSAAEAHSLATEGSAKVLGLRDIGRVTAGYQADLLLLRLDAPHFVPLRAPLQQMVLAESGSALDLVMIAGRTVLAGNRILTVDEAALRRQAEAAAQRLDAANDAALRKAQAAAPLISAYCRRLGCGGHAFASG